ncbi:hypothetical protein G6F57_006306 [Rhizopus arrhizus]|uniref:Sulfate transporter CysZ n=1 Tax=Rhizopus oryzae TaxID=64495 RepID=A0A9P6XJU8_RHIOR|nr:hypothetical protein G6F24_003010 [Rhizopus arrhizus]KAG1424142.1 hypothetical protein G6F58_002511 [Rhizopus delemar]KAG0773643.1 hypothetical protein G6F22_014707 [Rhizopus arrhizus]KAG0794361.1 hypothetical protein G6F21_002927 [Rhizopus arrhizus]KAG0819493.1 hypothetical protein G6F20_000727 [Rhizopus arrhizus]
MSLPEIKRIPSFVFPFKGIYFLLTRPKQLWLKTVAPILLSLVFSVFSIGFSLKVLFPRQFDKLIELNWPEWMSWFVSAVSVILESAILNLIFFAILVPMFQDAVFDATLKAEGLGDLLDDTEDIPRLVIIWRNIKSSVIVLWVLLMTKIFLLILTAPLQLIPVLGTALACYINGWPTAWSQHLHYDIEVRGLKVSESYRQACKNKWNYANFGAVAFALELIPLFNFLFVWTNIVGTALWVSYIYKENLETSEDQEASSANKTSNATEQTPLLQ